MIEFANPTLLKFASETLKKSEEVADLWSGTLYEKQIEANQEKVVESLKQNDIEKIHLFVNELARFVDKAENNYKETSENGQG